MNQSKWISVWSEFGDYLRFLTEQAYRAENKAKYTYYKEEFDSAAELARLKNSWFTKENTTFCLTNWGRLLNEDNLTKWLAAYSPAVTPKTVGIVMAGNIPMVGLHDLLCVTLMGHKAQVKLSSKDEVLLKWIFSYLETIEGYDKSYIEQVERLNKPQAAICTGSDNSARYFEYYFKEIPHIIRKNRTSVAVLSGKETEAELMALGEDVFRYFGLGCRNVTQLLVPENYDWTQFISLTKPQFGEIIHHNAYANNYAYNRTIFLMNQDSFFDFGWCLFRDNDALYAPIGSVNYKQYGHEKECLEFLESHDKSVQCVVSSLDFVKNKVSLGQAQKPDLENYADGIDCCAFLNKI